MSGNRPFARPLPEETGTKTAWAVFVVLISSALFRAFDMLALLPQPRLWGAGLQLFWAGLLDSPYREGSFNALSAARKAGLSRNELRYGETPVVTARRLLRRAGAGPGSSVVDLGAGRGRVLLAARSLGADAVGVELLDEHRLVAAPILERVGAHLLGGDALEHPLAGHTHIWLTWTCLSEARKRRMQTHLRQADPGAVVAVTSQPFVDVDRSGEEGEGGRPWLEDWELVAEKRAWFTWGPAPVFLYRRRADTSS